MSVLDGPFSDLQKARFQLSLDVHLEELGLSFKGEVWTEIKAVIRQDFDYFFPGNRSSLEIQYGSKQDAKKKSTRGGQHLQG